MLYEIQAISRDRLHLFHMVVLPCSAPGKQDHQEKAHEIPEFLVQTHY
jgi:hypothetical protein